MAETLQPYGDRLVVAPIKNAQTTPGGIVLPEASLEKPQRGNVVAVGVGQRDQHGKYHRPNVAVGDEVIFHKYAGQEVRIDAETYTIISEDDILAVVQKR